jgi:hypothetical protein
MQVPKLPKILKVVVLIAAVGSLLAILGVPVEISVIPVEVPTPKTEAHIGRSESTAPTFSALLESAQVSLPIRLSKAYKPRLTADATGLEFVLSAAPGQGGLSEPKQSSIEYSIDRNTVTTHPYLVVARLQISATDYAFSRAVRSIHSAQMTESPLVTLAAPLSIEESVGLGFEGASQWFAIFNNDGIRTSVAACESSSEGACHVLTDWSDKLSLQYWFNKRYLNNWPALDANLAAIIAAWIANSSPEFLPKQLANAGGDPVDPRAMLLQQLGINLSNHPLRGVSASTDSIRVFVGSNLYVIPRNYISSNDELSVDKDGVYRGDSISLRAMFPTMVGGQVDNLSCLHQVFICHEALSIFLTNDGPDDPSLVWRNISRSIRQVTSEFAAELPELNAYDIGDYRQEGEFRIYFRPKDPQLSSNIFDCTIWSPPRSDSRGHCHSLTKKDEKTGGAYWIRFNFKQLKNWNELFVRTGKLLGEIRKETP